GEGQEEDEEQHVELVHAPPPGAAQPRLVGLDGGAGRATEGALARGHRLLLPSHARLLVMLALAQLGQDAGLLTLLLEAADRALDGLVLLDPNPSHAVDSPPPRASGTRVFASRSRRSKERSIRQKWKAGKVKLRKPLSWARNTRLARPSLATPGVQESLREVGEDAFHARGHQPVHFSALT